MEETSEKCLYCNVEYIMTNIKNIHTWNTLDSRTAGSAVLKTILACETKEKKSKKFWDQIHADLEKMIEEEDLSPMICENHKNLFHNENEEFAQAKKELKNINSYLGDVTKSFYIVKNGLKEAEPIEDNVDGLKDVIRICRPIIEKLIKALECMIQTGFTKRTNDGELKVESHKNFYKEIILCIYSIIHKSFENSIDGDGNKIQFT